LRLDSLRRSPPAAMWVAMATSAEMRLRRMMSSDRTPLSEPAVILPDLPISCASASSGPRRARPMSKSSTNRVTTHRARCCARSSSFRSAMSGECARDVAARAGPPRIGSNRQGRALGDGRHTHCGSRASSAPARALDDLQAMHDLTKTRRESGGKIERDVRRAPRNGANGARSPRRMSRLTPKAGAEGSRQLQQSRERADGGRQHHAEAYILSSVVPACRVPYRSAGNPLTPTLSPKWGEGAQPSAWRRRRPFHRVRKSSGERHDRTPQLSPGAQPRRCREAAAGHSRRL